MDFLYPIFLSLHSILRWLVILAGLLAIIRAINGIRYKRGFTGQDNAITRWFTVFMDLQVMIGLILYFALSPITTTAMQNFGGAMGNSGARYFLVEHSVLMVIALIVAHIGRSRARKADKAPNKHRQIAIWFAVSLVILLAGVPWPLFFADRPWLRFFGLF